MLNEDTKAEIQAAYRAVLAGKDLRARYGQRLMIAEIARYLGEITEHDGRRTSAHKACVLEREPARARPWPIFWRPSRWLGSLASSWWSRPPRWPSRTRS